MYTRASQISKSQRRFRKITRRQSPIGYMHTIIAKDKNIYKQYSTAAKNFAKTIIRYM